MAGAARTDASSAASTAFPLSSSARIESSPAVGAAIDSRNSFAVAASRLHLLRAGSLPWNGPCLLVGDAGAEVVAVTTVRAIRVIGFCRSVPSPPALHDGRRRGRARSGRARSDVTAHHARSRLQLQVDDHPYFQFREHRGRHTGTARWMRFEHHVRPFERQ